MEDRARRIVQTAVDLAEKGGFEAVRLRDVAACANVALGTLYRHFRSKEDLLVAALAEEVEQLEEFMSTHPARGSTPLERVGSFFNVATRGICRRPMLAQAVLRAATSGQPELAEKVAAFHGRVTRLITAALRGASTDGETLGDQERAIALVLEYVWFASLVGWGGGLHDKDTIVEHMRSAASLMLPS